MVMRSCRASSAAMSGPVSSEPGGKPGAAWAEENTNKQVKSSRILRIMCPIVARTHELIRLHYNQITGKTLLGRRLYNALLSIGEPDPVDIGGRYATCRADADSDRRICAAGVHCAICRTGRQAQSVL